MIWRKQTIPPLCYPTHFFRYTRVFGYFGVKYKYIWQWALAQFKKNHPPSSSLTITLESFNEPRKQANISRLFIYRGICLLFSEKQCYPAKRHLLTSCPRTAQVAKQFVSCNVASISKLNLNMNPNKFKNSFSLSSKEFDLFILSESAILKGSAPPIKINYCRLRQITW